MAGFFKSLFGANAPSGGTVGLLDSILSQYPANTPPHPGPAKRVSAEQAEENLAHFMATRDQRLRVLAAVMGDCGFDIAPILDPSGDPAPVYGALTDWLRSVLPPRDRLPGTNTINAPTADYIASDRSDGDILYSFVADLALLEGEAIIRRRPEWGWDIAGEPEDAGADEFRRVALIRPANPPHLRIAIDLELGVLSLIYTLARPDKGAGYVLGDVLGGVIAGRFDTM